MNSFIHLLSSPACIVSFDGTFVDMNEWFVKSLKADSKEEILNHKLPHFVMDKARCRTIFNNLLRGNAIRSEKLVVKNMMGKYDMKLATASVLSFEKHQVFIQIVELFLHDPVEISYSQRIMDEMIASKEKANNKIVMSSRIAQLKQRLALEYPKLSIDETVVGALYILGLSSMEIALYAGFSTCKVKEDIFNVCQKLNMQSRDELTEAFL